MAELLSVEEAQDAVLSQASPLKPELVPLEESAGRVLAEEVLAPADVPAFDNSAMDGLALRWADLQRLPAELRLAGESAAGRPGGQGSPAPGTALRISTGALVPAWADTVVPIEACELLGPELVRVHRAPDGGAGSFIRRRGTFLRAGAPALSPGSRLQAAQVGLIASFNHPYVFVFRRPRVSVITTGDELVSPGTTPGPGQIVDSNGPMLAAMVGAAGGVSQRFPAVPDRREALEETFRSALATSDVVLSVGGVSVGAHDHVRDVIEALCDGVEFWKVRMKPGKPLAFGVATVGDRRVYLMGLPGNPASSFATFHLFAAPLMACLQGAPRHDALPGLVSARLGARARGARGRRAYLAGHFDGETFMPAPDQNSGNPALFAHANAMGIVEADEERGPGEPIQVLAYSKTTRSASTAL